MNKNQLLNILNKSADSICLHDASLRSMCFVNNSITFTISIGKHHFLINNLDGLVDNIENTLVLTLEFNGINNIECGFYDDFRFDRAEIMDNVSKEGIFKMNFLDCGSVGNVKFEFNGFSWDIVGEFTSAELNEWFKENGIYQYD